MQKQLLDEFSHAHPLYQFLVEEVAKVFEEVIRDPEIKIHSFSHRIKSHDSLSKKLERPDRIYTSLYDVTDIVGFRIITYFEDGIDAVAQFVEENFSVDLRHSIDKRQKTSLDQFGYRSLHYVCRPSSNLFHENGLPFDSNVCFEIQIRSILEHAWAEIEHDLGYKSSLLVPVSIRRRFSRLSGLLELADQEFVEIKESLAKYEREATQKIAEDLTDVPIDRLTLKAFLDEGRVQEVEQRIAKALKLELSSQFFFVDYLVNMLHLVGLAHIDQLSESVALYSERLIPFLEDYFKFAKRAWNFSRQDVGCVKVGYSLLFIAHLHLLESRKLGVELVEATTNVYASMDYANDRDKARAIAIQFVESVSRS